MPNTLGIFNVYQLMSSILISCLTHQSPSELLNRFSFDVVKIASTNRAWLFAPPCLQLFYSFLKWHFLFHPFLKIITTLHVLSKPTSRWGCLSQFLQHLNLSMDFNNKLCIVCYHLFPAYNSDCLEQATSLAKQNIYFTKS